MSAIIAAYERIPEEIEISEPSGSYTILTGRVNETLVTEGNPELRKNLFIANQIVEYVQNIIPDSSNFMRNGGDFDEIAIRVLTVEEDTLTMSEEETLDRFESAHCGNCYAMSEVGYRYAVKSMHVAKDRLDKVHIVNGDHYFLIVGYSVGTIAYCDPWSGACYAAAKASHCLRDYKGLVMKDGKSMPKVAPMDSTQKLALTPPFVQLVMPSAT
jgi:hypothetical protein